MRERPAILAVPLLAALLALGALPAPAARAASGGTISGRVVAATAGAAAVGETDVTLHTFAKATGDEIGAASRARTDGTGRFSFAELDTAADRGYVVTAEHRGITYSSALVVFATGETTALANVEVYEPTDRAEWIWLRQQHVIVTPDPASGTLQVVEIAIVQNGGDTTFVGADRGAGVETVRLALPSQAYDVDLGRVLARSAAMQPGAIVYSGPLLPGQTELVLAYSVALTNGGYALPKLLTLDTDALEVLVEDVGLTARSAQLSGPVTAEAAGKRFLRLSGRGIAAGTLVSIELAGSGAASAAGDASKVAAPLGLGALALATGYLLLAPRLRRSRRAPRGPTPARRETEADDEIVPEADP